MKKKLLIGLIIASLVVGASLGNIVLAQFPPKSPEEAPLTAEKIKEIAEEVVRESIGKEIKPVIEEIKPIPKSIKDLLDRLDTLRKQIEKQAATLKVIIDTKPKNLEVADLLAKKAAELTGEEELEEAESYASRSLNLLIKVSKADREVAETINAYAETINNLTQTIRNLRKSITGSVGERKNPVIERKDPHRNFRFLVEIDGIPQARFSEVIMPDASIDVIEHREGNEPPIVKKLPGRIKYGNIILKWGVTDSLELYDWWKLAAQGKMKDARRNMAVVLLSEEGSPAARWHFHDAWPVRYKPPDLTAKGNEATIETMEIAFEGMTRVQ